MPDDRPNRRADQALLDETAEDLYEHAPCGYLSTLPDGTIAKVNQTLLDWTGYARDALVGSAFQTLLPMGARIYYETHYAPLLQMQGFANEIAIEVRCADGRLLPILLNARQRRDEQGAPLFHRITIFDATDRRRYEHELLLARRRAEQVGQDKAALLAMLSHDIRNPLNALMGYLQLLEKTGLSETQRRYVGQLRSSSANILELVDHVLAWSRLESRSFALAETRFSLRSVVADVVAIYDAQARGKGLALQTSIDERLPPETLGDPIALSQVLSNLIANAVKFTERGHVRVAVRVHELAADSATIDVAVSDTGIGIAPEALDRIFGEFTQASYETAKRFGGTGLGLAIAKRLLSIYGSRLRVESVPGKGATFSFTLRLMVPKPEHDHRAGTPPAPDAGAGR